MLGDVGDDRAFEPNARVVPAHAPARPVVAVVESPAGERREVDAADEGDAVVDDHELLVVAVHRPLLRVEPGLDARSGDELVAHRTHLAAVGMEERDGCTGPREHPHRHALGGVGEERAENRATVAERHTGRERPAGDVHVRAGGLDLRRDARQRLRSVDEQLHRHAFAGPERAALRPPARRRRERARLSDACETPAMVAAHDALEGVAEHIVDAIERSQAASARRAPAGTESGADSPSSSPS